MDIQEGEMVCNCYLDGFVMFVDVCAHECIFSSCHVIHKLDLPVLGPGSMFKYIELVEFLFNDKFFLYDGF